MITKKDKLKQYIKAADFYYQNYEFTEFLSNKPFSHLPEVIRVFHCLSFLLPEMYLAEGQKIIDFGAGVCWLSRLLSRLGFSTISVDVSFTALQWGKSLYKKDGIANPEVNSHYVTYDGFTLPFKDASIDRIFCYDALHHVENLEDIAYELHRILKEGGIAGFFEPGLNHSDTAAAQYEMKKYGILEKDLDIFDIMRISRNLGFSFFFLPVSPPGSIKFNDKQLEEFFIYHASYPTAVLAENAKHSLLFFLIKGKPHYYSNAPHILTSRIEVLEPLEMYKVKPNEVIPVKVKITNTGDTTWLATNKYPKGIVQIGTHLLSSSNQIVNYDYYRMNLPSTVTPGQSFAQELAIPAPAKEGQYAIVIDLLSENICWFEYMGSPTCALKIFCS